MVKQQTMTTATTTTMSARWFCTVINRHYDCYLFTVSFFFFTFFSFNANVVAKASWTTCSTVRRKGRPKIHKLREKKRRILLVEFSFHFDSFRSTYINIRKILIFISRIERRSLYIRRQRQPPELGFFSLFSIYKCSCTNTENYNISLFVIWKKLSTTQGHRQRLWHHQQQQSQRTT